MKINGKQYYLRCFGFHLNVAPLIMKAIVSTVMSQEEAIDCATSAYIDENVMPPIHIREYLAQFGLECKDPEWLEDSTWVLG